jgi:hypothetical protein
MLSSYPNNGFSPIKDVEVHLLNTGHFPLEEDLDVSVILIKRFLAERVIPEP